MKNCIFCSVAAKNKPHHEIVFNNKNHLAFLDINPAKKGHILIIPKKHTDFLFDLKSEEYMELLKVTRVVALSLKKLLKAKRVYLFVKGFKVRHVHIHLIPIHGRNEAGNLPRRKVAKSEFIKIGKDMRKMLQNKKPL